MATCIVSGKLIDATGSPLALAPVGVRLDQSPNDLQFSDGSAITRTEVLELTDEYGQFSMALAQGLKIVIRIDDLNLHRQVTVPNQASATLEELLNGDL